MKLDLKEEKNVWFILWLFWISYLTVLLLHWLEHFLPLSIQENIKLLHYFTLPPIFILWLNLFSKYLWKWKVWKFLWIIDFPNISWTYKWTFKSSFIDKETWKNYVWDMELQVFQTASNIKVMWKFNQSQSISTQASFWFNEIENKNCLYYFFKNKPWNNATETMHSHEGSCILCFDEENNELKWEYYSWRDRNNYWDIEVKKLT